MNIMLAEFGRYVADCHRTEMFCRAIEEQVRPGDVVVDLGTGFGLLALLAVRRGARHVYAIEQDRHIELARAIAADNGAAHRITFIHGNSAAVQIPEPADVLVAELFGQFAMEEFAVGYLHDAASRFLKPGGRTVPSSLRLWLTPVEMPSLRERWRERSDRSWPDVCGLNLARLRSAVLANELTPYIVASFGTGDRVLGEPGLAAEFSIPQDADGRFERTLPFTIHREGVLDGWLGTFEAQLSPSVLLSTAIAQPPTHWRQVVFPIHPGWNVARGRQVAVQLGFHPGGTWSYGVRGERQGKPSSAATRA